MTGIIISGHGNFATGLLSAIKLVMGNQENLEAVDFLETHSTEELKNNIQSAMYKMNVDGYLFFTDISGGSPFKSCVELSLKNGNSEVIAGSNVPMIMEILINRLDNPKILMNKAIEIGKDQILSFDINKINKKVEVSDGI